MENLNEDMIEEPKFVIWYANPPIQVLGFTKTKRNIYLNLLWLMDYKNEVKVSKKIKKQICETLNISLRTLNMGLSNLCKSAALWEKGKSLYVINPECHAYGDEENTYEVEFHYPVNFKFKES